MQALTISTKLASRRIHSLASVVIFATLPSPLQASSCSTSSIILPMIFSSLRKLLLCEMSDKKLISTGEILLM